MTSFSVLGGSSPFNVLEDELDAGGFDEEFELDAEVEDAGLSCWFLSFSRRCFKYNVLFILDSDLWCPVVVDSTCSTPPKKTPEYDINDASKTGIDTTYQLSTHPSSARLDCFHLSSSTTKIC